MTNKQAEKVLKQVAMKNGVTVQEVRKEIQNLIVKAQDNPDPEVQKQWKNMKFKGVVPTPEEFIMYMVDRLNEEK